MGTGAIAHTMATTVAGMTEAEVYAVASRTAEKAQRFAQETGAAKAYGSYQELAADKDVDLVYIATPHSEHYENMLLCLNGGRNVLTEKSFTVNSSQAEKAIQLAQEKRLYLAEAIWTRYMPSRKIIDDTIASGIIGKPSMLTANLSYSMLHKQRLVRPELAGGALLDVGVYPINFALMHFGDNIEKIESSVSLWESGVDAQETITVFYKDGRLASLSAGMLSRSDRKGIIWGEKGYIVVENINNPQSVSVFDSDDRLLKATAVPKQITGYEYEVREALECIAGGKTESFSMPFAETVKVMRIMDSLRRDWGVVYPGED